MNPVLQIVAEQLCIHSGELSPSTRFDSLDCDSLEFLNILLEVKKQLGVWIEPSESLKISTVGDLAEAIHRRLPC